MLVVDFYPEVIIMVIVIVIGDVMVMAVIRLLFERLRYVNVSTTLEYRTIQRCAMHGQGSSFKSSRLSSVGQDERANLI